MKFWLWLKVSALLLLGLGIAKLIDCSLPVHASYSPTASLGPNVPWLCVPASASGTAYTCTPTLVDGTAVQNTTPANGQQLVFFPDVSNTGPITIKVDGVNARSARTLAGVLFVSGDLLAGVPYSFSYESSVNRWIGTFAVTAFSASDGVTNAGSAAVPNFQLTPVNGQGLFGSLGGSPPTIGAGDCGTTPEGTVAAGGNNNAGTINVGGGAVLSCKLTFGSAFVNPPACVLSDNSTSITGDVSSVGTGSVTFGFSLSLGGGKIYYHCF